MENLCLYDFVAEYTNDSVDEDGNTKYRQLPTTRYTIQTERRSERVTTTLSSCSSCFVYNEEILIGNGENAESAFNRHLKENHAMNTHSKTDAQIAGECAKDK